MPSPQPLTDDRFGRTATAAGPAPFAWATVWVVAISLAVTAISAAASVWLQEVLPAAVQIGLANAMLIGIGSGMIAVVSLIPGLIIEFSLREAHSNEGPRDYTPAVLAGILIRLLGTVALFLLCRYQMAPSADTIAGWILGWYILLTATEVVVLAKRLPKSLVSHPFHRPSKITPE